MSTATHLDARIDKVAVSAYQIPTATEADVTRCSGITNMLRVDGLCEARNLRFSAHCAPAISAHACCWMETVLHVEHFSGHYRIESLLFDGTLNPGEGLLARDRSRPGLGIEFKQADASRSEV